MHLEETWSLTEFHPILFCNTYGLHLLNTEHRSYILVLDINGNAHWIKQNKTINLKRCLEESERHYADFDIELIASDSYIQESTSGMEDRVYLATCWIIYDQLFAPEKYFAAFFMITLNDFFKPKLLAKFDLKSVPTYTRLTSTPPISSADEESKNLFWLVFTFFKGNCAFHYDIEKNKIEPYEKIGYVSPFLKIEDLPGSAIRSQCSIIGDFHFAIIGYDTGYVIASVCLMKTCAIIDRKSLKFDGPISVLKVIKTKFDVEFKIITIMMSSTIGPVTIWELQLQEESLVWKFGGLLLESEVCDAVITTAICREQAYVGTYGEQLLIYDLNELQKGNELLPIHTMNIASPILSISFIDDALVVLSNKGLHIFKHTLSQESPTFVENSKQIEASSKFP